MASIPLAALNISNLLKIRKTKIFGKTHKVIECVMIFDSFSRERYEPSDISPDEKRKTIIPMTNGKINPLDQTRNQPVIFLRNCHFLNLSLSLSRYQCAVISTLTGTTDTKLFASAHSSVSEASGS